MRTKTGFELTFSSLPCSNSIDPETLEGSGEIRMEHGHKPLLMLLYLQKWFREEFPKLRTDLLAFATDDGRPFQYRRFDDLKPLVIELGLDTEAVRKDAEQLGLASKVIQFSEIETEVQDHYF
jgi:hypothetical protein